MHAITTTHKKDEYHQVHVDLNFRWNKNTAIEIKFRSKIPKRSRRWCCWSEWRSASRRSRRIPSPRIRSLYGTPLSWILPQNTLISVPDPHRSKQNPQMYIYCERERERERDTFAIGLVAALNKADTVLGEVSEGIDDWVNGVHFSDSVCVWERERERERELDLKLITEGL